MLSRPRLGLLVLLLACAPDVKPGSERRSPAAPQPSTAPDATLSTDTGGADVPLTLRVEPTPPNPMARLVTLANPSPRERGARVAYGPDGALTRRTAEVPVPPLGSVQVAVLGLYPGEWSLAVEEQGATGSPSTVTVAEPAQRPPTTEVLAHPSPWSDEEAVCVALETPPRYACTDRQGRPTLDVPLPGNAMFVRPLSDGTFVAHPDGPPFLYRFDALGRELDRILLDDLKDTTYRHDRFDEHDLIEITEGPWTGAWAVLTATEERVGERWVTGAGLIVFDPSSRAVLWDWSSHGEAGDDLPIDPLLAYGRTGLFDYGQDWLHANAVVHRLAEDGTDTFWLSLRHQDWVIAIQAPDGAVRWRLGYQGDFTLVDDLDAAAPVASPAEQWMFHQHAIEPRALAACRA